MLQNGFSQNCNGVWIGKLRYAMAQIKDIISQNVKGLVGMLPSEDFAVQITTDRENLANLRR